MSSGFVSGGTIDDSLASGSDAKFETRKETKGDSKGDDAWRLAQEQLAESQRKKEEAQHANEGKSLYEVLQANKAAKEEAFAEATRLKNQYRALDDDEAEFVNSVLESTRKKEAEVKKDTIEQLEAFRRRQEEAERKALEAENAAGPVVEDTPQWNAASRKRKKSEKDGALLKGVKLRRASTGAGAMTEAKKVPVATEGKHDEADESKPSSATAKQARGSPSTATAQQNSASTVEGPGATAPVKPPKAIALALGYESSDDDD